MPPPGALYEEFEVFGKVGLASFLAPQYELVVDCVAEYYGTPD